MSYNIQNVTAAEASRAIKIPLATIQLWVKKGWVAPAHRAKGSGYDHLFSIRQALALAVGRDIRNRGLPIETAQAAMQWLLAWRLSDLNQSWLEGRTLMLVVGKSVFPTLATRDEIYSNPHLDIVAASTAGVPVAVVDIQKAYTELNRRILADRAGIDAGESSQLGSSPVEKLQPPGEKISA